MPLRLAIDVTPMLGRPTGVGGVTKGLFDALVGPAAQPGIELSAFALSTRGYRSLPEILPPDIGQNRLPMPASLLAALWRRGSYPRIENWLGTVDVVHGTNFVVPPTRGAALVTVHDLTCIRFPEICEPHTLKYPKLIEVAVARGAHVHTFSDFVADEVNELLGVDRSLIHVIAPGLDNVTRSEDVGPASISGKYVLALGTVEPRKNYSVLVRAFDAIAGKHSDTTLVIAGARGWDYDNMSTAIGNARYKQQIRYMGRVNNAERNALLANATALAYPSIYEGYGLPPLEAMRAGVPVVATRVGAVTEVAGDAALLVNPDDDEALAVGLDTVLSDDETRRSLVKAGTERVANMAWSYAAARFIDLYRELAR